MKVLPKGQRIWADHHLLHKQGRATRDIEIKDSDILKEYDDWIAIKPLDQSLVDKPFEDNYPDFWIEKNLLVEKDAITPPASEGAVSDQKFLEAMKVVKSWFKQ